MCKRFLATGLALVALSGCDTGADLHLLPGEGITSKTTDKYQCDNSRSVFVTYLHNNTNALAVINLPQEKNVILVNVTAASGERYVGGRYEWWVNGDSAQLTNVNANETIRCTEKR
ncbi:membrane-bound lysozyme inhibitor of C-type lysozyme [Salmonella enterica subsp. enterica serovar Choleraesuis]|nr:membrane-bound lysozyme inhibitor of C-type lysozyme [Salmonella enterica subsp. enterica serovar Choleraesuis]